MGLNELLMVLEDVKTQEAELFMHPFIVLNVAHMLRLTEISPDLLAHLLTFSLDTPTIRCREVVVGWIRPEYKYSPSCCFSNCRL